MNLLPFRTKKPAANGPVVTLEHAVRQGLVALEVRGTGEGVTSSVDLKLTKLVDGPLTILVPRGSAFKPFARP
jgi:hypothetical protein